MHCAPVMYLRMRMCMYTCQFLVTFPHFGCRRGRNFWTPKSPPFARNIIKLVNSVLHFHIRTTLTNKDEYFRLLVSEHHHYHHYQVIWSRRGSPSPEGSSSWAALASRHRPSWQKFELFCVKKLYDSSNIFGGRGKVGSTGISR